MSKYYKVEDVINTLADQWHYEATIDYPYAADDIEEWKQNARELFADLPTIEIVECGECRWRDDCSQTVANIEWTVDTMLRWCSDGERKDNE